MKTIYINAAFKAGWQSFIKRPWYLLGLMLAFSGLFVISLGNALVTALAYILYGGFLAMLIAHFRGARIVFDDIIPTDSRWISFAVLALVKMFLIFAAFLFFIIPGIYLSIRWMFAEMLVIDQGMRPLEALKASSTMTAGVRGKLFWLFVAVLLLNLVGLMVVIVGVLVTSLISMFAIISLYEILKAKLHEETTTPLPLESEAPMTT